MNTKALQHDPAKLADPAGVLSVGGILSLLFARNRAFVESLLANPGASNRFRSRTAEAIWPKISELSLLDRFRIDQLAWYFEQALDYPGDVIECGTYQGGVSILLASMLREFGIRKKVYMLDSFAGLPTPDRRFDGYYSAGWLRSDVKMLQQQIERRGLSNYCVIKKGWFKDTLQEFDANQSFCFVHIDCDLYESCRECLDLLYPRLADGVPMVFDDYYDGSGGVQKAVDEWTASTGEIIHLGPAPQATVVKGMNARNASVVAWRAAQDRGPLYSSTHLMDHESYHHFLSAMTALLRDIAEDFGCYASVLRNGRAGASSLEAQTLSPLFKALLG